MSPSDFQQQQSMYAMSVLVIARALKRGLQEQSVPLAHARCLSLLSGHLQERMGASTCRASCDHTNQRRDGTRMHPLLHFGHLAFGYPELYR